MNTKMIADYANGHVNTVRLYEQWGYISLVPRAANGYRQYTIYSSASTADDDSPPRFSPRAHSK